MDPMIPNIEDHINRPRDTVRERALARQLRELPESTRFKFVQQLLAHHLIVGLKMAKAVLQDKQHFQWLLYHGLEHGNASTIRFWLAAVIPKLGSRSVIYTLKKEMPDRPVAVFLTLYWLPSLIDRDAKTKAAYKELMELAKTLNIEEKAYRRKPQ